MRTRLQPGETVQILVRRHWIVLAWPFTTVLFLLGCLVAAGFAARPWLLPAASASAAVASGWALWRWLDWRCDLWAVTQQRVIDEWGVLTVTMIDSPLERINNITFEQSLWGRLLGYGTLVLQTAAEEGKTEIDDVARPAELREAILSMKNLSPPGALPGSDTKECPFCAERIKARATVCRFCGRNL